MLTNEISQKYTLNVELTEDYRLVSDGTQYIILRRHVVDPTKSPAYDPAVHSAETREDWREHKYFGLTAAGLGHAIDYVAMRRAANLGEIRLDELIRSIDEYQREFSALIASI